MHVLAVVVTSGGMVLDPAAEIAAYAQEIAADLVVLGHH